MKAEESLGRWFKVLCIGRQHGGQSAWCGGEVFCNVLVFYDPGAEVSRSHADRNLFSSKEVLLAKKEQSVWCMFPPSCSCPLFPYGLIHFYLLLVTLKDLEPSSFQDWFYFSIALVLFSLVPFLLTPSFFTGTRMGSLCASHTL